LNQRLSRFCLVLPLGVVVTLASTLQQARGQGQPGTNVIPLRPLAALSTVPVPTDPNLKAYIYSNPAAVALGKALFWDMQAGSDGVQACATCHFNAGADSRTVNQISPGIKAGDGTFQLGTQVNGYVGPNYKLNPGTAGAGFGGYHDGDWPLHKQGNVDTRNNPLTDVNDVVSSQGVFSSNFDKIILGSGVDQVAVTSDSIFSFPDPADPTRTINTRRVEPRNTPSVINAVFNDRNFWDGRAQNICNGANPFGARDTTSHFFFASSIKKAPVATLIRVQNSSLCSQALGPALSNFEMSASGRDFRALGQKLLSVNPLQNTSATTPLGKQLVDPTDSVLGTKANLRKHGLKTDYASMIQAAFQKSWWQSKLHVCVGSNNSESWIDPSRGKSCPSGTSEFSQMEYNFSLFWGLAIQAYEATLRADQTPLDKLLSKQNVVSIQGDGTTNIMNVTLSPGIVPYTVSVLGLDPRLDSTDQDVFAFDDGQGNIIGPGISSATIDYASGVMSLFFELPPNSTPIKISYNTGKVPLTQAQLHGFQLFMTKGRCINCHGGPELTNAAVGTVNIHPYERMVMGDFNVRVYDNGFYNIGVRPAVEDIGVGGGDGINGAPLSNTELAQAQVCSDPSTIIMVPGRLGEGITAAPLACWDQTATHGAVKAPGLRNVALTAPYFHNGGQLTLEQVVEFYNRGGDFLDGFEQIPLIDPDIESIGFTMQEKTDLVDFLRNALTDPRVVAQSAPFDHPQIFLPDGHPADPNGYPVASDPNHPGQAQDLPYPMMMIPAVGKAGASSLPSFLQNLNAP
jgi:cytochrome c peroxidase